MRHEPFEGKWAAYRLHTDPLYNGQGLAAQALQTSHFDSSTNTQVDRMMTPALVPSPTNQHAYVKFMSANAVFKRLGNRQISIASDNEYDRKFNSACEQDHVISDQVNITRIRHRLDILRKMLKDLRGNTPDYEHFHSGNMENVSPSIINKILPNLILLQYSLEEMI